MRIIIIYVHVANGTTVEWPDERTPALLHYRRSARQTRLSPGLSRMAAVHRDALPARAAGATLLLHAGLALALLAPSEQEQPKVAMQVVHVALVENPTSAIPKPESAPAPVARPRPSLPEKIVQAPAAENPVPVPADAGEQPVESREEQAAPQSAEPPEEVVAEAGMPSESGVDKSETEATSPVFEAAYLRNRWPEYPRMARRLRQEGVVELRVRVSAEGMAEELAIAHSSGVRLLDQAALDAVRTWRFVPARRGSNAVEAWVVVPIQFKLEG